MTAVWEPVQTLTTKRSRRQRAYLERNYASPYSNKIAKLDNGVLIDVWSITFRSNYASSYRRTEIGEICQTDLAENLGMGVLEFRIFREQFDTTFPKPSRIVTSYSSGHEKRFWDVEEVLEWADKHQTT